MKTNLLLAAVLTSSAMCGLSGAALAQNDAQEKTVPANQFKPAAKAHKVWTNDEVGTLRTPADAHIDEADRAKTESSAAKEKSAADNRPAAASVKSGPAPVFTNPKSVEDANKMIAWETRDIDAQQEFLVTLQKQIDEAPDDQKERLRKLMEERTQILASTRLEMKNVQSKKKDLEKQEAVEGSVSAAASSNP
jgi:hypothetical protein